MKIKNHLIYIKIHFTRRKRYVFNSLKSLFPLEILKMFRFPLSITIVLFYQKEKEEGNKFCRLQKTMTQKKTHTHTK